MPIDPLQTWKDELENLPKVSDNSWALNFANWYALRIVGIEPDPAVLTSVGWVFPFPVPVFASALISLTPTNDALAGIQGFADAWELAILSTIPVIAPGSFIPPPTPATIFSAIIPPVVIDPASVAAGKAKLVELVTAPPVSDPKDSQFPVKFREATLLLTVTVNGLNSVPPPAGPQPLTAPAVPLI